MKAKEIKVGGHYRAKISGRVVTVRVDAIRHPILVRAGRDSETTVYDVTNLSTGRKTTFRSAMKFRCPARVEILPMTGAAVAVRPAASVGLEAELKHLAAQGAAGTITAEEHDRRWTALVAERQQQVWTDTGRYHAPSHAHPGNCPGCTLDETKFGQPITQ